MTEQESKIIYTHFIEQLISGICHDLGAPARHVVQFTQMLEDSTKQNTLEEKHHQWISIINNGGSQIQTMLTSLVKLSQLSSRNHNIEVINLQKLFTNRLNFFLELEGENTTNIESTINGEWPNIEGYKNHWHTLFSCLIDNALKFQPNGKKHVIELTASCEQTGSQLVFCLEDNGIGVSDTQLNNITRPFKQLNRKDDYPGDGMGLCYCNYISVLNNANLNFKKSSLGGLCVTYTQILS